jgi:hypothetical protein
MVSFRAGVGPAMPAMIPAPPCNLKGNQSRLQVTAYCSPPPVLCLCPGLHSINFSRLIWCSQFVVVTVEAANTEGSDRQDGLPISKKALRTDSRGAGKTFRPYKEFLYYEATMFRGDAAAGGMRMQSL